MALENHTKRDISFRDVLHALQCTLPASAPPLPAMTLPSSPSSMAMVLLATASLQFATPLAPPRPIAIRPKQKPEDDAEVSLSSSSPFASAAASDSSLLLQLPYPPDRPPLQTLLLPFVPPPVDRRPHIRAIAPRPSGTPPSSSASSSTSMVDSTSSSLLYLSPRREPAELSDSSLDIKQAQRSKSRRKTRLCHTPGCGKYVVDHGLCIAHGGGRRCKIADCNCRAQNRGLCWKHGGFTICTVEGCERRAKSRGICWSHGGGTKCKTDACDKIAVSHGRCWAHGGGKRCLVTGCKRPASERMNNCCADHFDPFKRSDVEREQEEEKRDK